MIPPRRAIAPPESPVPEPRPTRGTSKRLASFTISTTSFVLRGKTTRRGAFVDRAVVSYSNRSSAPASTPAGPRTCSSSRMSFASIKSSNLADLHPYSCIHEEEQGAPGHYSQGIKRSQRGLFGRPFWGTSRIVSFVLIFELAFESGMIRGPTQTFCHRSVF